MERVALGGELVAYTLDDDAQAELSSAGVRSFRLDSGRRPAWSDYGSSGFARTAAFKYVAALDILAAGRNALFVDGDIVFLRNPLDYLAEAIMRSRADLLFQFEAPKNVYNTGFWFARCSSPVVQFLTRVRSALEEGRFACDQVAVNTLLSEETDVSSVGLDAELFACGNQFLDGIPESEAGYVDRSSRPFDAHAAYILHFNYLVGKREKVAAMRKHDAIFDATLEQDHGRFAGLGPLAFLRRLFKGAAS
jgi:hypothetical protein